MCMSVLWLSCGNLSVCLVVVLWLSCGNVSVCLVVVHRQFGQFAVLSLCTI